MGKKQATENAYPSPFEDSEPLTPAEEKAMVKGPPPSYAGTFAEPVQVSEQVVVTTQDAKNGEILVPMKADNLFRKGGIVGEWAPLPEKPRKKSGHLTNRTPWLQCAAKLESVLAGFPASDADMALEFVVKARKPPFIPPDQH